MKRVLLNFSLLLLVVFKAMSQQELTLPDTLICGGSQSSTYTNSTTYNANLNTNGQPPFRFGIAVWLVGSTPPTSANANGVLPGYNNSGILPTTNVFSSYVGLPRVTTIQQYNFTGFYQMTNGGSWIQTNTVTVTVNPSPSIDPSPLSILSSYSANPKRFCNINTTQITLNPTTGVQAPDYYVWYKNTNASGAGGTVINGVSGNILNLATNPVEWGYAVAYYNSGCSQSTTKVKPIGGTTNFQGSFGQFQSLTNPTVYLRTGGVFLIGATANNTAIKVAKIPNSKLSYSCNSVANPPELQIGTPGALNTSYTWYFSPTLPNANPTNTQLNAFVSTLSPVTNPNYNGQSSVNDIYTKPPVNTSTSSRGFYICKFTNLAQDSNSIYTDCFGYVYTDTITIKCCDELCYWTLNGNSPLASDNKYIGTNNATDFVVKTNSSERIRISGTDGSIKLSGITTNPNSSSNQQSYLLIDNTTGVVYKSNSSSYNLRTSNSSTTPTQQQIDDLKAEVKALKEQLAELLKTNKQFAELNSTESKLYQNSPNPFTAVTKIEYFVASENNNYIAINTLNGKPIKTIVLNGKGKGIVELSAGTLSSGTYTYSLYAGGVLVDTKLMVISK